MVEVIISWTTVVVLGKMVDDWAILDTVLVGDEVIIPCKWPVVFFKTVDNWAILDTVLVGDAELNEVIIPCTWPVALVKTVEDWAILDTVLVWDAETVCWRKGWSQSLGSNNPDTRRLCHIQNIFSLKYRAGYCILHYRRWCFGCVGHDAKRLAGTRGSVSVWRGAGCSSLGKWRRGTYMCSFQHNCTCCTTGCWSYSGLGRCSNWTLSLTWKDAISRRMIWYTWYRHV